jgi:ABC-2 type transport system ATP-binding protein
MDPLATRSFQDTVARLKSAGKTILLTTHDMGEADAICDRVSFINHGNLVATGDPKSFHTLLGDDLYVDFVKSSDTFEGEQLQALLPGPVEAVSGDPGRYRIRVSSASQVAPVVSWLLAQGVSNFSVNQPSLEDVYIALMRQSLSTERQASQRPAA